MTASPRSPAKLLPTNFEKGMLIDDECMGGVSKEIEGFSVFIVDHVEGAALFHEIFPSLDAALHSLNSFPRAWRFEATGGCSGERCGEGNCKGEGCKIYVGPKTERPNKDTLPA